MMRFYRLCCAMVMGMMMAWVCASPVKPTAGVEYQVLNRTQPIESGKKVEVLEFFWYACPHCNAFDPMLSDWVNKQGDNIVFKRVPVEFRPSFVPQQKLYYTLETMGKLEALHKKIFYAVHVERQSLDTDGAIFSFVEKQGVDKTKFMELYQSFAVQTKARRASQLQAAYHIDGVPAISIDGRYMTSPSLVGSSVGKVSEIEQQMATLRVMDALVIKARKERGGQ